MEATDSSGGESGLDPVWRDVGRRLAAGSAAFCALLSLLHDASVPTAALRGGITLVVVSLACRVGFHALHSSLLIESRSQAPSEREETP